MSQPVLWQFKYSHYNEKVRWALDYKRIPHVRRSLLPGPHALRALWLTGQKAVPVLQLDGQALADSTRIIAALESTHPEPPLYPADPALRHRALELEEYFDEELGPHLRVAWFFEILSYPDYSSAQLTVGFSPTAQRVYRLLFPGIRAIMTRDMGINAANAVTARAKVAAALDRLEAELQPSGYLVGSSFTVADLTAAALFSPVVMPPEFPYPLHSPPPPARTYRDALAARPGFKWVLETYSRHRGTSSATPLAASPQSA
jgi:glutathione S-transferase